MPRCHARKLCLRELSELGSSKLGRHVGCKSLPYLIARWLRRDVFEVILDCSADRIRSHALPAGSSMPGG